GVRTVIFSAPVTTALVAGNTITISHPAVAARTASASAFSGIGTVGRLDQTATKTGNTTGPNVGPTASNTSQADELVIASFGVETKKSDPFTVGAGYTALPRESSDNTAGPTVSVTVNPEFQILSATGMPSAAGSITPARNWAGVLATYRATCGNGVVEAGEQ